MASYYGQRQMVRHTAHPQVPYNKVYQNMYQVRQCRHANRVVQHHGIRDREAFFSILASGFSIVAALVSFGICL